MGPTHIGNTYVSFHVCEFVKRALEVFQADPRLIDWNSDDDELLDVHTTVHQVLTNKRSCVVTSVWPWPESKGPA